MKLAVRYEIGITDREIEAYRVWMELGEGYSSEDVLKWIKGTLRNSGRIGFQDIVFKSSGKRLLRERDALHGDQ
jgi:hypothetical protein